jgi:Flp pilus assembly protein TadG
MRNSLASFLKNERGAVAPIVALSMFGLIAAGGIAFDYARLATMDTELQQAADQAALAAAGQLDRVAADPSKSELGAQARARAAINGTAADRLASNITRFANDSVGAGVEFTVANITFCKAYDDSKPDATACTAATNDTDSRFVVVTTTARTANYAFTPIVAAFSGTSRASAVAGVESSICNIAPLMVCAPDDDFPDSGDVGKGLVLKPLDGISGNYGLLDFGSGTGAVTDALLGHGLNGCQAVDDNETEPGSKAPVTDAINTRMDVYAHNNSSVWNNNTKTPRCDPQTGTGCPSDNTSKDMVFKYTVEDKNSSSSTPPAAAVCPAKPDVATAEFVKPESPVVGFGRDTCHYTNSCGTGLAGNVGDGAWDRTGYFATYHGGDPSDAANFAKKAATDLTRYDVYRWELDNPGARLGPKSVVTTTKTPKNGGKFDYTVTTQCTYSKPIIGSSGPAKQKDRRVLPIVAANCSKLKGKGTAFQDYVILRVFDIFLTEPSQTRTYPGPTEEKEIYGEIIGPAGSSESGSSLQYYTRNKPYLVR